MALCVEIPSMSHLPSTEFHVDNLSHDGHGVARRDGKVCFIKGALPGETVKAHITQRKSSHDHATLTDVIIASHDRVEPFCPLVAQCGGCQLQHLDHAAQINYKQANTIDLITRQSGLVPESILQAITSAPRSYRRRARLAVYTPNKGRPLVGFRESQGHQIVAIDRCPVLHPLLQELPALLNELVAKMQRPKLLGHIELALIETQDHEAARLIHLRATEYLSPEDFILLQGFAAEHQCKISLQFGDKGYEDITQNDHNMISVAEPNFSMHYRGGDFMQANQQVNAGMVSQVIAWLDGIEGKVLDAFCGLGNFSIALALKGHTVTGVEVNPEMVKRAQENAAKNGVEIDFLCRDLMSDNKQLARKQFSAMVLDPPRDGAKALLEEMVKKKIPRIAYISCNPATLARDASILAKAGYKLEACSIADMFPQTSHVETLALFSR